MQNEKRRTREDREDIVYRKNSGRRGKGRWRGTKRRQGDSRMARKRAGQGLALENVKPTDSPIYRPPSEFAIRAFRKTFAGYRRDKCKRGNRGRKLHGRRGVPLPIHSRTDAAFLPSLSHSLSLPPPYLSPGFAPALSRSWRESLIVNRQKSIDTREI